MNKSILTAGILNELIRDNPALSECRDSIEKAYDTLHSCFANGGKLLLCGNGGSAADCEHIAGELMKEFLLKRPVSPDIREKLEKTDPAGVDIAAKLQAALPCVSLTGHVALSTAFSNDADPNYVFAQQVFALGRKDDVLLGISTSGNARNVYYAAVTAKALGMKIIGLTGQSGGELARLCDTIVKAPDSRTYRVQEYHLPIYHAICAMLEAEFFGA